MRSYAQKYACRPIGLRCKQLAMITTVNYLAVYFPAISCFQEYKSVKVLGIQYR
jgi:hypothetical protein